MPLAANNFLTLNAQAAELIREGNLQSAIPVLRAALNDLAGSIHDTESQPLEKVSASALTSEVARNLLPIRSVPSCQHDFTCQDHQLFFMFDRALYMEATDPNVISAVFGKSTMAVIILYNLGLVYQLQGIRKPSKQKVVFEKAMRLYRLAVAILEKSPTDEIEMQGLVYMSVLNNMAHIYSHFYEERAVQWCLDWLEFILEVCPARQGDLGVDYMIFRVNVVTLRGQKTAAAAAE